MENVCKDWKISKILCKICFEGNICNILSGVFIILIQFSLCSLTPNPRVKEFCTKAFWDSEALFLQNIKGKRLYIDKLEMSVLKRKEAFIKWGVTQKTNIKRWGQKRKKTSLKSYLYKVASFVRLFDIN